jgi:hypothetical protein
MESDYLGLKATEQVLLWRMLDQGPRFRPYDAEALRFYRDKLGRPLSVQQAQKALESLRQRTPALVWKSARGEYAVGDAAMHRWFQTRQDAGARPPCTDASKPLHCIALATHPSIHDEDRHLAVAARRARAA